MKINRLADLFHAASAVALLTLSSITLADALPYDESVSGDSTGGQIFTLVDGDNIFSGSQAYLDTVDGLRFIVANGKTATISLTYQYSGLATGDSMATYWGLFRLPDSANSCIPTASGFGCEKAGPESANSAILDVEINQSSPGFIQQINTSGVIPIFKLNTLSLPAGTYAFNTYYKAISSLNSKSGVLTYTITIHQG